ncbi:MAG TPA: glycosyltransferase family 4 protein [Candidatus Eisenbacteria bacterium]|nr:glycosyltransferase family 4 protein [Candidatus Eisenbacteria bacterium]
MLNILTFDYEYPPLGGGGGVVHALIAEELAKRHHVAVITSAYGNLPARETLAGVEITRVPILGRGDPSAASLVSMLSYPPAAWIAAARSMSRRRYDVVHAHFAVPTGPGSLPPAMIARIPHVMTIHGGDIFDPSKKLSPHRVAPLRWTVTAMLRGSQAVATSSQNIKANAYKYYGYRGPIEIIPLGIRQPEVPPASRAALGLPEHVFLAVTVGRLVKRKGLEQLLRAFARPECAALRLVIVGAGPEMDGLRAETAALGIGDRVLFTGRVEEERKWQILAACDAYVSATLHEGFGLVYLEGMAAGLPVVTPDHGGQIDFLRDGETGYVVPAGDLGALAAALARIASNPEEAKRMGAANRKRAPEHRIDHCAGAYEALYERVVREKAGAAAARGQA